MAENTAKNADFIGRVVGDAANPPDTRMLTGWLGDAGEADYRRLYTDAELSSYVDIPTEAILYTEPIRDAQPAGAVFVWIKRDAAVKQGGSAYSRAARFLQGQVQQDYASGSGAAGSAGAAAGNAESLEKAGLRCATQAPCGEVTGFGGQCTNEPQVGGAWPCITARPHCTEPTGFTGQCTHQPWPNPTRYIGCTIYHCPTHDLTHIPPICNIVATGLPGCGGINPPDKGDPAARDAASGDNADNKEAAAPATVLPGCGYTKTWGLCETHLLGCGQTKECPTVLPGCGQTNDCPTTLPGCGWSKNPVCTDLPGCGFTKHWGACQPTLPPKCHVSIDNPCIPQTEMPPQCGPGGVEALGLHQDTGMPGTNANFVPNITQSCPSFFCTPLQSCPTQYPSCPSQIPPCIGPAAAAAAPAQGGAQPSLICATNIACNYTQLFCHTRIWQQCHPTIFCPVTPYCPTRFQPQCFPYPSPFCPVTGGCPFGPGPVINPPVERAAAFDVAAPAAAAFPHTAGPTICTQIGPGCPGTAIEACTQLCTHLGPHCPPNTAATVCTQVALCHTRPELCDPAGGGGQFAAAAPQTVRICTQIDGQCRTVPNGDCTFFGGCPTHGQPHCPPTPATVCTQFAPCHTPSFECTMFCTHGAPGCPPDTHAPPCTQNPVCQLATIQDPGCLPNTHVTFCTQTPVCRLFTVDSPGCPPHTHALPCPPHTMFGPGCQVVTVGGPQCPVHSGFNCPSAICHSLACQSIACQPGGGGQQQEFAAALPQTAATVCTQAPHCVIGPTGYQGCQHTVTGCPEPTLFTQPVLLCHTTRLGCTQSGPQCPTHALPHCTSYGPGCPPTPATVCTQFAPCPTHHLPCHTPGFECTMFCTHGAPGCPHDTLATVCTQQGPQCPPHTIHGPACPVLTAGGPQCPVHSGFNCPSAIGCQSVACQSIACQPGGGGGQQEFAAALPQTAATVCTQIGPQCPRTHLGQCPSPGVDCTVMFCTHVPQCPDTRATVCTQYGQQCPHTRAAGCTHLGQCPSPGIDCTVIICTHVGPLCPHTRPPQCPPPHTPLCQTVAGPCPPHTIQGPACPVLTVGGPQCPVHSGFNCPSAVGCQSIACQSIACHPGDGGQQEFAAAALPQTAATVCTQAPHCAIGPTGYQGCQHTMAGCPEPTLHTQPIFVCQPTHMFGCTHVGPNCATHIQPHCPPTPATICTQFAPCPTLLTQPITVCAQPPMCPVQDMPQITLIGGGCSRTVSGGCNWPTSGGMCHTRAGVQC